MDWIACKNKLPFLPKRFQYIFAIVLLGVLLMVFPDKKKAISEEVIPKPAETAFEESLAHILANISGAGNVEVLLSQEEGERVLYQTDEVLNNNDTRRDTVIITDANRCEQGMVQQILPPVYRGAIVLCQGADNAYVKLSVVEAIKSITGLSSDRITVLKMK